MRITTVDEFVWFSEEVVLVYMADGFAGGYFFLFSCTLTLNFRYSYSFILVYCVKRTCIFTILSAAMKSIHCNIFYQIEYYNYN